MNGNGIGKISLCFAGDAGEISRRRNDIAVCLSDPLDEGLGHSFCYIRPDPLHKTQSLEDSSAAPQTTAFRTISGASISANTSTPLSTDPFAYNTSALIDKASAFESSNFFSSIPLQPIPRNSISTVKSGPILRSSVPGSGPIERGFLSGPIERSFISGPLENQFDQLQRYRPKSKKWALVKNLKKGDSCENTVDSSFISKSLDSKERVELDRRLREKLSNLGPDGVAGNNSVTVNHLGVLKALSEALRKTEASYLEITDMMLMENPELALMGSCVLAMVMKGDDVYLMNVGDSRGVLAQKVENDAQIERMRKDYEESSLYGYEYENVHNLSSSQLTMDHSTSVKEEVRRIRNAHPDDASAVINDRVKGSLKVTRAFGAGFLKKPKWNNALLEMFRIDYIGTAPYITCSPSLCHHRLDPKDKFLILSSDGLYQYFTNQEAVSEVETFMSTFPEGDPAQHLVEEVLFRAAKKAGMDFHELLDIPQGDRRRYHDDVSIIIISFEGRIWRSSV
ncbi:UNVERIFIED_CONTAM: putative protein phosphatase 2C 4 [Sesamum angustifolium]|uniref:PPM-type phosphatase domain-containing protein n=1 Tax=Sesamum angustifolium TaxID=2727405 RepID=A0AAW2MRW1_9LAMI